MELLKKAVNIITNKKYEQVTDKNTQIFIINVLDLLYRIGQE
jgi:hypothetical protein